MSPVSRLERDLKSDTVTPSDGKIRSKIIPFPGYKAGASTDSPFKVGAQVSHPRFGSGKVIGVENKGEIVSVIFDDHGPKKIFADAEGFQGDRRITFAAESASSSEPVNPQSSKTWRVCSP